MSTEALDRAIRAVCPITGVNSNRVISFDAAATAAQRAAAQEIADGWDFDDADKQRAKAAELDIGRAEREKILNRLNGIRTDMEDAGNTVAVEAIKTARQQLKDMTQYPPVVAATTGEETHVAFLARYREIATQLAVSAPAAYLAFRGLDL